MKLLDSYGDKVEIKNKYFKYCDSYWLLDKNLTRIDFKFSSENNITYWTGDYVDDIDQKEPFVKNKFSPIKKFFANTTNNILVFAFLFFVLLFSTIFVSRFHKIILVTLTFVLLSFSLFYMKFVAKPEYEKFLSEEKKRLIDYEEFLYSKRIMKTEKTEPKLSMKFYKTNGSINEFLFIVRNKKEAMLLQKELATAIFREISSIDKAPPAPQVEEQENVTNNRRAKSETN